MQRMHAIESLAARATAASSTCRATRLDGASQTRTVPAADDKRHLQVYAYNGHAASPRQLRHLAAHLIRASPNCRLARRGPRADGRRSAARRVHRQASAASRARRAPRRSARARRPPTRRDSHTTPRCQARAAFVSGEHACERQRRAHPAACTRPTHAPPPSTCCCTRATPSPGWPAFRRWAARCAPIVSSSASADGATRDDATVVVIVVATHSLSCD